MKWWIGFILGLFTGLIFGYFLLREKLDTIETYLIEALEGLKGKSKDYSKPSVDSIPKKNGNERKNSNEDVKAALLALGYKASEADKAIAQLPERLSTEDKIRMALQHFDKGTH
jgi:hypothetical protein